MVATVPSFFIPPYAYGYQRTLQKLRIAPFVAKLFSFLVTKPFFNQSLTVFK